MYNKVNALIYELIQFLCRFYPLKQKVWIRKILDYCREDWVKFRTEVILKEVDKQTEALQKVWKKEDEKYTKPMYIESPPDGSKAQELLGGEMRLSAPWTLDKHEPSD